MQSSKPGPGLINLGLIGAGRWGRNYIKTLAALDGVRLARLASRNPESASLVDTGCVISADWRVLVDAGDLDGIIVATPPAEHAAMAAAALAARVPVLVEKPLTMAVAEAQQLLAQSRSQRSLVMVEHTHLFHPAFEELCRQRAALGAIRAIRGDAGNHGPYRTDVPVLWDWGPHDVAMCIAVTGQVPRARAAVREERREVDGGIGESIRLELGWDDGVRGDISLSNIADRQRRFTVFCEDGVLVYDDMGQQKLVIHPAQDGNSQPEGMGRTVPVAKEFPLTRAVRAFVAAIAASDSVHPSLALGVDVVGVLADCARLIDQ